MMTDMKKIMMIWVLGALVAFSVPAAAQDFNSTSAMQGSGSTYSSPVTPVGAQAPEAMASTANAPHRPTNARRGYEDTEDPGHTEDEGSPIGSAWALLAFAAIGGGVVLRRRKRQA